MKKNQIVILHVIVFLCFGLFTLGCSESIVEKIQDAIDSYADDTETPNNENEDNEGEIEDENPFPPLPPTEEDNEIAIITTPETTSTITNPETTPTITNPEITPTITNPEITPTITNPEITPNNQHETTSTIIETPDVVEHLILSVQELRDLIRSTGGIKSVYRNKAKSIKEGTILSNVIVVVESNDYPIYDGFIITFHKNGTLHRAAIASNALITIRGYDYTLLGHSVVTFSQDGNLLKAFLHSPSTTNIVGYDYTFGSSVLQYNQIHFYDSGLIHSIRLSVDILKSVSLKGNDYTFAEVYLSWGHFYVRQGNYYVLQQTLIHGGLFLYGRISKNHTITIGGQVYGLSASWERRV